MAKGLKLQPLPVPKRSKDSKKNYPIHDDMTIALKHYEVINAITKYMLKHDEKATYLQVKENHDGKLVVHAEANDDVQMFIYNTLKDYNA